ncbi:MULTISPECIES: Hint domain-containing protein [unclassified Ruegeria]|uniref:Hint domain-containing protein n=1 Tax=unclassified Ruegeria TaxID=2625375 RepID=UPI001487E022|nr:MULTISPECIES: Hint domain-containing protein [unclassified Ruegeria]
MSVVEYSNKQGHVAPTSSGALVSARRGGFVHGTKVATTSGWKPVERLVPGDRVRTLDNGFKEVRRISTDTVAIPEQEQNPDNLPILVPSRAAYNGRPVWIMPEQGMALDHSKIDPTTAGSTVVAARLLKDIGPLRAGVPAATFDVCTLFFDEDQVIFIEGGLQAYCAASRFGQRSMNSSTSYHVTDEHGAADLLRYVVARGSLTVLSNPLGALPAPIPNEPIFPVRPATSRRRPGRPGRPGLPTLFLRSEWMMIAHHP